jgi:hypothetical protein
MNNSKQYFTCAQGRQFDIVEYLSGIGHEPQRIRGNDYWYLSPLRKEKTASFKVNRKLNRWYDHGIGQGGNIIDFAILYFNCTVKEFLLSLRDNFSFHQLARPVALNNPEVQPSQIFVRAVRPLHSLVLIRYLYSRKIPLSVAAKFCKEIGYEMNGRQYYSVGFLNDACGYELRNPYCKNSSAPKTITTLKNSSPKIAVFEGFFDFLSFQVLLPDEQLLQWDYCILNSLSFFQRSMPFLEQYSSIHLFLDRDTAGQNCSKKAMQISGRYKDESIMYKGYKDLNDWLVTIGKVNKCDNPEKPP